MITLYADSRWESPWVLSVYVTLKEKELEFQERSLDLEVGDQKAGTYAASSLTARVPAIDIDGFVLSESTAIVEYLEERYAPPHHLAVLPLEIQQKARARQIMGWLRTDLAALRRERPTTTIFYEPIEAQLSADAIADAEKLKGVATRLLPPDQTTLFDRWSVADVDLAVALMRLEANRHPLPPALSKYARAQWERASVIAFRRHAPHDAAPRTG
jgi:glutathione S-transferase